MSKDGNRRPFFVEIQTCKENVAFFTYRAKLLSFLHVRRILLCEPGIALA